MVSQRLISGILLICCISSSQVKTESQTEKPDDGSNSKSSAFELPSDLRLPTSRDGFNLNLPTNLNLPRDFKFPTLGDGSKLNFPTDLKIPTDSRMPTDFKMPTDGKMPNFPTGFNFPDGSKVNFPTDLKFPTDFKIPTDFKMPTDGRMPKLPPGFNIPGMSQESECSCMDCIKQFICTISDPDVALAIKLMMTALMEHNITTQKDVDAIKADISSELSESCTLNKVMYLTAYFFDLPMPKVENECETGSNCMTDKCFKSLLQSNISDWEVFPDAERCEEGMEQETNLNNTQLFAKILKSTLIKDVKHKVSTNFSAITETVRKHMSVKCPTQRSFTLYDSIRMTLTSLTEFFSCSRQRIKPLEKAIPLCHQKDDHEFENPYGSYEDDLEEGEANQLSLDQIGQLMVNMFNMTMLNNLAGGDMTFSTAGIENRESLTRDLTKLAENARNRLPTDNRESLTRDLTKLAENARNRLPTDLRIPSDRELPTDRKLPSDRELPTDRKLPSGRELRTDRKIPTDRNIPDRKPPTKDNANQGKANGKATKKSPPLRTFMTNERMRWLNVINDAVGGYYNLGDKQCYDDEDNEIMHNCGPYKDELRIAKQRLINKMHKVVIGCSDCQKMEPIEVNGQCEMESLQKRVIFHDSKMDMMARVYEKFVGCKVEDKKCIERNMMKNGVENYVLAYNMMKTLIGCKNCSGDYLKRDCTRGNCIPEMKTRYPYGYLQMYKLASVGEACDALPSNQGLRMHGMPSGMFLDDAMPPGFFPDDEDEEDFEKDSKEERRGPDPRIVMDEIKNSAKSRMFNKLTRYLSIQTANSRNQSSSYKDKLADMEAACKTSQELQKKECQFFLRRLQYDVYSHIARRLSSQDENSDEREKCSFNSENGTKLDTSPDANFLKSLLYSLVFTGCSESHSQDAHTMAVRQCSYFTLLYQSNQRTKQRPVHKIFGDEKTFKNYKKLMEKYPGLFKFNSTDRTMYGKVFLLFKAHKCNELCPSNHKYCNGKCLPSWSRCSSKSTFSLAQSKSKINLRSRVMVRGPVKIEKERDTVKFLPKMYSDEPKSGPMNVSVLAERGIVIVNKPSDIPESGVWQYNVDGSWTNLTSLSLGSGVKLDMNSTFRYRQYRGQYGLRMFSYYADSSDMVAGEVVQLDQTVDMKEAFLLIHPKPARVRIGLINGTKIYKLKEDELKNRGFMLSKLLRFSTSLQRNEDPIPKDFADKIPKSKYQEFLNNLKNFDKSRPVAKVSKRLSNIGSLWMEVYTRNGIRRKRVTESFKLDHQYSRLVFEPKKDYNGNFSLDLEFFQSENSQESMKVNLMAIVTPVNDPPSVRSGVFDFPAFPFNMSGFDNDGLSVDEIITRSKVNDPESGNKLGIAILKAFGAGLGTWQVKKADTWEDLKFDKQSNVFLANGSVRIRMKVDKDEMWKFAKKKTFIAFKFWDFSDGQSEGYQQLSRDKDHLTAYSRTINGRQLRKGCNNVPDSAKVLDKCGVCGGFGRTCRGCDGDPKAKRDQCKQCTGGSTGKKFNYLKDCAGQCGKFEKDSCNVCKLKDSKTKRNFTDCSGTCFGRARLDKCGVCSGGKTGVLEGSTLDICNVCGGDGSSCNGCDKKSGKDVDLCGNCLLKTDTTFNSGCFKLLSMDPKTAPAREEEEITIQGAGFTDDVSCSFKSASDQSFVTKTVRGSSTKTELKLIVPSLVAGSYSFSCTKGSDSAELKSVTFKVYASDKTSVDSISPSRAPIQTKTKVTVKGTGFVNTGEIQCLFLVSRKVHVVDGTFVDSSNVECEAPSVKSSISATVALSFTKKRWSYASVKRLTSFKFEIYAAAPQLLGARIQDDFRYIALNFSSSAWTTKRSCKDMFSRATIALLGKSSRCYFKGDKILYIRLDSKATITIGDKLTLNKDAIKARFQRVVDYTPETEVTLTGSTQKFNPVASIYGKNVLSSCEDLKLSAHKSTGGGKRRLSYFWDVSFADSSVQGDLTAIKNQLAKFGKRNSLTLKSDLLASETLYNFTLSVENYVKEKSASVIHQVRKVSDVLPVVRIFGDRTRTIKASRRSKFISAAKIPKCMDKSEKLKFSWTIEPSADLDSKSSSSSSLYIYPGTLFGNEVYTLTVTVSLASDLSKSVSDEIELHVKSSDLITRISGGRKTVIGSNEDITLDGSKSYDPDKTSEEAWFDWECEDMSTEGPCYVADTDGGMKLLEIDSASKVNIDNNLLTANSTYKFSLNYQKGMRSKSSTKHVRILGSRPPRVIVRDQKTSKVNVEDEITVRGMVASHIKGTNIWFESMEEIGYSPIDLSEEGVLLTPVELITENKRRPVSMVFNKNVLDSGVSYKFKLHADNSGGNGYAEFTITTNSPPTINMLVSDPSNGTALDTEFTLTALEGYDEDGDLPLTYNFGYINANGKKQYLGSPSTENTKSSSLPTGRKDDGYILEVFVEISDALGGKSEYTAEVVVAPPATVDSAAVANAMDAINDALATEDLDAAIGSIASSLSTFNTETPATYNESSMTADEVYNMQEVEKELLNMKDNITNNVLTMTDNIADEETQDVVIGTLGDTTEGATAFSDDTKINIVNTITNMVEEQIVGASTDGSRKRRSTDDGSESKTGKSPSQVEDLLRIYENTIDPSNTTDLVMTMKKNFTDLIPTLAVAMCQGLSFGRGAVIAKGKMVEIQTLKEVFANISTRAIDLDCGSGSNCSSPAKVVFSEEIENEYSSFSCGAENCTGACIGSVKYTNDLFSNETSPVMITDIVSVTLIDPEQDTILSPGISSSGVEYQIPLTYESDTDYFFQCQMWDESSSKWSADYCKAMNDTLTINFKSYVVCKCDRLGTVGVSAGEKRPVPTMGEGDDLQYAAVRIIFDGDWDTIIAQVNQSTLEKQMKTSIVAALNVEESRVQNVTCTKGSILTSFELTPTESDTQSTLDTSIDKLKQEVNSGTFVVNLKQGLSVTASKLTHAFQYNTLLTEKSIEESNNYLKVVVIVLVLFIGGGLTGGGAYFYFRQNGQLNGRRLGNLC